MNPAHRNAIMIHRRDVLRGCLRCGGLLALGGLATALGLRSPHDSCQHASPCDDCPIFPGCDLPKARDAQRPKTVSSAPATPGQPTRPDHA